MIIKPKILTLIRHAKSSWDQPGISDHRRPLAPRGLRDALLMGENHLQLFRQIEQCYCSTAQRARETLQSMSEGAGFEQFSITYCETLYTFDAREVILLVNELPDHFNSILLVGHNPAFTETVNYFTDAELENMPTAAIAQIEFSCPNWQATKQNSGELISYAIPKNYR